MKTFILTITTLNRREYLQNCIDSFLSTRNSSHNWKVIIADDGSEDGTLQYLDHLKVDDIEFTIIKNQQIGIHQQVNSIFSHLEKMEFDFCFKVDDDLTFLKAGWDDSYYEMAMKSGFHHLVFCDHSWCSDQLLPEKIKRSPFVGSTSMLNVQGAFYTITKEILKKVGYMDTNSFGYRGMGHVDYTMRCARAGYTNPKTPWDIENSNKYLTTFKANYKGVLDTVKVDAYDNFLRKEKSEIIQSENRIYIAFQPIDKGLFSKFKDELIEAFTHQSRAFNKEKNGLKSWYEEEIQKIKNWYESQYKHLPNWYIRLGKIFKLINNR